MMLHGQITPNFPTDEDIAEVKREAMKAGVAADEVRSFIRLLRGITYTGLAIGAARFLWWLYKKK